MKKCIFIISLSLLSLVGCEKKYDRTIWVNPDVECCGVKDPLNNLEWLKDIYNMRFNQYEQLTTSSYEYIFLFRNDSNTIDYIVRKANMGKYSSFVLQECDGTLLDSGIFVDDLPTNKTQKFSQNQMEEPAKHCHLCGEFFKNNTLIDTIYYYIIHP